MRFFVSSAFLAMGFSLQPTSQLTSYPAVR